MSIDRQKIAEGAQKFASKGQLDRAIAEYQQILREDPNDIRTLLKVGDLHVRMGATQQAIETYALVGSIYEQQGLHQKAIAVYKQILQINPDLLALYGRLADLHIKLGLTSDALQALELLAQRHARSGDMEGLASTYRQILLLDSQNLATRIRFGELLSKMGRGDEAASEFEAACKVLDAAGRVEEWVRVAERVVFHRPTNVDVSKKLATYYLDRNDARRALPKIQAAYKTNPKDVATLELLATAFRALAQLPKTVSVLKEIARLHQLDGRVRERNEVYQRLLELAPTDPDAREALRMGSKPGVKRPSVPPAPLPTPPPRASSARPAGSSQPAEVVEVHDDALEEVSPEPDEEDEAVEAHAPPDGSMDVVFDLSQRPPHSENSHAYANPAIPPAPRVPDAGAASRSSSGLRSPFVPQAPVAPPPSAGGNAVEAARLLGEAEIFLKYGLRSKAQAHMSKAAELEPDSVDLHDRLRGLYVAMGDGGGVLRETLHLAMLYETVDPQAALAEATRALEIDAENPTARELYDRLHGGTYENPEAADDAGALIDEGDVVMAEGAAEQAPSSPADYFEEGYESQRYDDLNSATEIGESPIEYGNDEGYAAAYEAPAIPVVHEFEETTRGPPLSPFPGGRREIEEGLDEAEFFVTQGLYDDARDTLQQLLEMHPEHPLVLERLEEVEQLAAMQAAQYAGDPSYALADRIAEEVDGINPLEGPPTGQIDVETVLAQFKQGVGRTVSVEDCDTHYDLGIAYKEMGLLDDAIAEFKIATMNPERKCIGETMIGLCYLEKGDVPLALEHFKDGLQAEQRSEREELGLYFEMGAAYEAVGDLSEALYFFQKVDKRDPSFRNVRQRVLRLQGALHGVPESQRGPGHHDIGNSFDDLLKE